MLKAEVVSKLFISNLVVEFRQLFKFPDTYAKTLSEEGRHLLHIIASSDCAYHDLHHTIMVSTMALKIIKGKIINNEPVLIDEALHFLLAALSHDIGYVRKLCPGDTKNSCVAGQNGNRIELSIEKTGASLSKVHVDRSKIFVQRHFLNHPLIDTNFLTSLIERTRFPVPDIPAYSKTDDWPALLRGADLLGQFADPEYIEKSKHLYKELEETGEAIKYNYTSHADMIIKLPWFYKNFVVDYIGNALTLLNFTPSGFLWIEQLKKNERHMATTTIQ